MEHAGSYPLTGLRAATTAPQRALIDRAAEVAMARDFIPRGQRLARATGAVWPRAFQDATVAHVERHLGVTVL